MGHDLMTPYSVIRDEARVLRIGPDVPPYPGPKRARSTSNSELDFLSYVDEILQGRSSGQNGSSTSVTRRPSNVETPTTCRDAIELAILRSNLVTTSALRTGLKSHETVGESQSWCLIGRRTALGKR